MSTAPDPYYRRDLALVHHLGFGFHAARCAPGILELLAEVRARDGLVLELGCGTGLLTAELVSTGHRVVATDASPAMLELARDAIGGRAELRRITLPDDPLPPADAVVAVGHPLNYVADAPALDRALVAAARALRPGGVLALDVCDLSWGRARTRAPGQGRTGPGWAIVTEFAVTSPDRFVRDITTFVANPDGSWRRDTEHHENVLVDTTRIPGLLATAGVDAHVADSFGDEQLPEGLKVVVGRRPG